MNLEQIKQRFNLSQKEFKHLEDYFEKARTAEVNYDREFLQGEKCPVCFEEQFFLAEKGDAEAQRCRMEIRRE